MDITRRQFDHYYQMIDVVVRWVKKRIYGWDGIERRVKACERFVWDERNIYFRRENGTCNADMRKRDVNEKYKT